jgi:hypothetical protein
LFREILWTRPLPMPTRSQALKLILTALYLLMWPVLILVLAGDWCWPQGWIFGGWFLAVCVSTTAWLYRNDPALLAERYRALGTGGQSRRDKMTVYLIVLGYVAWIVLMPLDARRFRWTPQPPLAVESSAACCWRCPGFFSSARSRRTRSCRPWCASSASAPIVSSRPVCTAS